MFTILISAFNTTLKYIFQTVVLKFVIFGSLAFVVSGFITVISKLLPSANPISSAFSAIPAEMWYFFDAFSFSIGIPMIITAYVSRFLIRRIPVIG